MKQLGVKEPRVSVAGLNPHAGENGLFGNEEKLLIVPAIERTRTEGIDAKGPISPDTVFLQHQAGEFDAVVAQYHDLAMIPLKLV